MPSDWWGARPSNEGDCQWQEPEEIYQPCQVWPDVPVALQWIVPQEERNEQVWSGSN